MSDILLENVNFGYDKNLILKNINLSYNKNEFLSIIGPNGGGKSTLLKLILGLIKPNSGNIKVFGKSPNNVLSSLGYVPQQIPINENFPISVLEVVLMGRIDKKKIGFYSKKDKIKAYEALNSVGMYDFANSKISDISGGQRQRVYIARALCTKSEILLLDEPTASIDTMGQVQIYTLLKELNSKKIGIIMISHDINMALNFATKAAYIANGELIMHDIQPQNKNEFLTHLQTHHKHFCSIELALKDCLCSR